MWWRTHFDNSTMTTHREHIVKRPTWWYSHCDIIKYSLIGMLYEFKHRDTCSVTSHRHVDMQGRVRYIHRIWHTSRQHPNKIPCIDTEIINRNNTHKHSNSQACKWPNDTKMRGETLRHTDSHDRHIVTHNSALLLPHPHWQPRPDPWSPNLTDS